jgi:anti-sigma B factor antagonist
MTVMEHQAQMTGVQPETTAHTKHLQLAVTGDLDLVTARGLAQAGREVLIGHSQSMLSIDMSEVTFIDAAGVGALVSIRNNARLNDNVVAVTEPSRCVLRILDLTALTAVFTTTSCSSE